MPSLQFAATRFGNPGETKADFDQELPLSFLAFPSASGWSESFAAVSLTDRLSRHRTFHWRLLVRLMRSKVGGSLDWSRDPV